MAVSSRSRLPLPELGSEVTLLNKFYVGSTDGTIQEVATDTIVAVSVRTIDGDRVTSWLSRFDEGKQFSAHGVHFAKLADYLQHLGLKLSAYISSLLSEASDDSGERTPASSSLQALARLLDDNSERYPFTIFTPRSVNFGALFTYRQKWTPLAYQVGELVKTIPLAPKEVRKFSVKTTVKKGRKERELESSLRVIGDQSTDTGRAESEVVRKARKASNFASHAEASGSIGVLSFSGSADTSTSAGKESAKTKKRFRESVTKASQEFRQSAARRSRPQRTPVSRRQRQARYRTQTRSSPFLISSTSFSAVFNSKRICTRSLPSCSLPKTCRCRIGSRSLWLLRYDWILKRALLDDSFVPAFELLKDTKLSRDVEVGVRKKTVERQMAVVRETKEQLATTSRLRDRALAEIDAAVNRLADTAIGTGVADTAMTIFTGGLGGLLGLGGGLTEGVREAAEMQSEAAQEALQRLDREATRLRTRLEAASSALERAIDDYARVVREALAREQQILRLRVHVVQNILHYMHAIWEYEPEDQRFFRLHDIATPAIGGNAIIEGGEGGDLLLQTPTIQWHEPSDPS